MNWSGRHWVIFGLFLGGIGTAVSGLSNWSEALTPTFIGGLFVQLAAIVAAIMSDKPQNGNGTGAGINPTRFATLLVVGLLISGLGVVGCAAKTPLGKAQVAALSAGKAALAVDQAEYDAYGAGFYDAATHKAVAAPIRSMLYAVRGYERAISAWSGDPYAQPESVAKARSAVVASIDDLEAALKSVKGTAQVRAALRALRVALGLPIAPESVPIPNQAAVPFMAVVLLLWRIWKDKEADGTVGHFVAEMLEMLKRNGATLEELAEVDAELTSAIARREGEQ